MFEFRQVLGLGLALTEYYLLMITVPMVLKRGEWKGRKCSRQSDLRCSIQVGMLESHRRFSDQGVGQSTRGVFLGLVDISVKASLSKDLGAWGVLGQVSWRGQNTGGSP